ncbi:MAG: Uncharacterized protein Greene041614_341 [Parcubacteria group bacterium Greene0416_14]|nr:MAG: Uncharacterized protein Greene041614_341 [Parcubacteria group bacterium Greene0416_14]
MKKYLVPLCSIVAALLLPVSSVFAASVFVEPKNTEMRPGDSFEASVFIATENESINAIEGTVLFSEDLLMLEDVRDGASIVNFWIERPREEAGKIAFSGIIPGGYAGEKGLIFSAIFRAKKAGRGIIDSRALRVLLNDGEGTEAHSVASGAQIIVSEHAPSAEAVRIEDDTQAPEEFTATVTRNPSIFEGKYFLVFATQDKGSGIDHYEVCERGETSCVIAESPYVLAHQALRTKIIVRAIDKKGNKRVVVIPPHLRVARYKSMLIFGILAIAVIVFFVRKRNKRGKSI